MLLGLAPCNKQESSSESIFCTSMSNFVFNWQCYRMLHMITSVDLLHSSSYMHTNYCPTQWSSGIGNCKMVATLVCCSSCWPEMCMVWSIHASCFHSLSLHQRRHQTSYVNICTELNETQWVAIGGGTVAHGCRLHVSSNLVKTHSYRFLPHAICR